MNSKSGVSEQILRYIGGTLILIVATVDMLRIIGVKPDIVFDILKALILVGIGLFVAFYNKSKISN